MLDRTVDLGPLVVMWPPLLTGLAALQGVERQSGQLMDSLGQQRFEFELGPLGHAIAVPEGECAMLVLAMRAASSLWGGKRALLLPVSAAGKVLGGYEEMLDTLQVQHIYDFSGLLAKDGYYGSPTDRSIPASTARPLDDGRYWRPPPIVSYSTSALRNLRLRQASTDDPTAVAALGRFADPKEEEEWKEYGTHVLDCEDDVVLQAQLARETLLDATLHGASTFRRSATIGLSMTLLFVLPDTASPFDDLVWFWNTRALRPGNEGLDLLVRRAQLQAPAAEQIVSAVRATSRSNPSMAIISLSVPEDGLQAVREELGVPEHSSSRWSEQIFSGRSVSLTAVLNVDFRSAWSGRRSTGTRVTVVQPAFRPTTILQAKTPLDFAPPFTGVDPVEVRLRGPLLEVPLRPAVADLFHRGSTWRDEALAIKTALLPNYDLELQLPSPGAILHAAAACGFSPSDKARQLRAVLERERELDLYRRRSALAIVERLTPADSRQFSRLLDKLDPTDRETVRAAAMDLRERSATASEIASSLGPLARGAERDEITHALNRLVDVGHVQRGLRADCSLCDTKELRLLGQAPAAPKCTACGADAVYAPGPTSEPVLYYRLSALMRLISASGGLPVLATVALLKAEGAYLLPGANIQADTGESLEVDLLGWHGRTVLAGECKRSSAGFKDLERDVLASSRVGASLHLAATLDTVDEGLRGSMAAAAKREGLELRVLDISALLTG